MLNPRRQAGDPFREFRRLKQTRQCLLRRWLKTLGVGLGRGLTFGSLEQVVRTARNPLSTGPGMHDPNNLVIIHHRHTPRTLSSYLLFCPGLSAHLSLRAEHTEY